MLERFFMVFGYGLCHQLPERSFFSGGYQVPVCARDTGIYIGFIVSTALIALLSRRRRPTELPSIPVFAIGALFLGAMVVDGVTSYAGMRTTTNDLRLLTGLLAGFSLPLVAVPIVNSQLWRSSTPSRPLDRARDLLIWIASVPLVFAFVRWVMPLTGVLYPWIVVVAVLVTFTVVNLVFVCLVPFYERRADRLREALPQVMIALALTVAELALAGLLRWFLERGLV